MDVDKPTEDEDYSEVSQLDIQSINRSIDKQTPQTDTHHRQTDTTDRQTPQTDRQHRQTDTKVRQTPLTDRHH